MARSLQTTARKIKQCLPFKNRNSDSHSTIHFVKEYLSTLNKNQLGCKIVDDDDDRMDFRRLVFVSLNGLFNTWRSVPFHKLWTALILVPFKREWIYHPSQHKDKLKTSYCLCLYSNFM